MGQPGFYDLDSRLKALSAKGHPLEALEALVPFESFRSEIEAEIEAVVRLAPAERKSNAGRKALFDRFNGYLNAKGYIARDGQIVDATIVSAPKQHRRGARNNPLCKRQQTANTTRSRLERMAAASA